MKGPRSFSSLLDNNRFLIVFAFLIALVSWITVAMNSSDTRPVTIQDVPIRFDRQIGTLRSMNLDFISMSDLAANVHISGSRTIVGQLSADDFILTVSVTQVTDAGTYSLRIVAEERPDGEFNIVGISPEFVTVRLDEMGSIIFPVDLEIENLDQVRVEGYMSDTPRLVPASTVRIGGPRGDLERVDRVVARVALTEPLDRPYTQDIQVELLDMTGNVIDHRNTQLTLDIEELTVQIPVLRVRTLPLVVDYMNMPPGFPEAELRRLMRQSDQNIMIAGPISTMANYEEWRLGFINLRHLSPQNNVFTFDVILPSEQFINMDNTQSVLFEFDAQNWGSETFNIPGDEILLVNRPAGVEVTLQSGSLNGVTIVGDQDVLDGLTVSDIVVEINLNDRELTLGPQPFPVRVSVPGRGMVWPVEENNNFTVYINVTEP